MTIKHTRTRVLGLLAAGLLMPALAGCSKSPSEESPPPAIENDAGVIDETPAEAPPAVDTPEPAPAVNMAEDLPPPPPERTVDQQMLDDASATGMTARVQREREPAPADTPAAEDKAAEDNTQAE